MILAPVVANRKGEQVDLFAELRAQGFVRLRIDSEIHEIDALPELDKNKKHNIDVVIDRLKVREDTRQRLAESFEVALRHADGRAIALNMDTNEEHLFRHVFPALTATLHCRNLSPVSFRLTTRWAHALNVMASASSSSLTRNALSPIRSSLFVRSHSWLGSAQPVLFPDGHRTGGILWLRRWNAL